MVVCFLRTVPDVLVLACTRLELSEIFYVVGEE